MDFRSFDTYIKNTMESWDCPGVAIAIVKENEVVYRNAFGYRDVKQQLPLTADTRFPLASVTKSFTAMSAALLVDDGLLEWDKPVCHYMPEFILDDPYITRHITVRDMLSHRTGMPRHDKAAWRLDLPLAEFIKRMRHLKFSATFRERYQYNNLMYSATGYLVEKITGQTWQDFIRQRIFTPLGMTASNFDPATNAPGQLIAEGYRHERDEEGKVKELVHTPFGKYTDLSPGSAGALVSTLTDLTQWMKAHINDGVCDGVQLVSRANLKQMHSAQIVMPVNDMGYTMSGLTMMSYGMGWMMRPYPYVSGTLISHGGNVEGHSLEVGFMPEAKLGVVVLTNAGISNVPIILLREAIDRMLGADGKDWNARFHKTYDPMLAAIGKGKTTSAEDRLDDAPATLALDAYVGSYAADGYPDFDVRMENGQLQACTVGSHRWSELRHYQYDVFEWHVVAWDYWVKVKFQINEAGEVGSVSIPIEPDVSNVEFVRKSVVIDEATLAAIVGKYDTEMPGLAFSISCKNGKLYWQDLNQPIEAKACGDRGTEVEFRVNRSRAVFYRTDGVFTRVALKTPDATYEGYRR
jgi:CubicO group peptidase (beta-lactamase class C family)